jgi:hypothetical protein
LSYVSHAKLAEDIRLEVDPPPDVVTRGIVRLQVIPRGDLMECDAAVVRGQADKSFWRDVVGVDTLERQRDEKLFRVFEWGGMMIET